MKIRVSLVFCLFLAFIVVFLPDASQAETAKSMQTKSSQQTIGVSMTVSSVIYSFVENGQLVVQTNSSEPVCVLENGFLRSETAWIGHDAKIALTEGNSYTTLACI
jgi:hypothetical protein